MAGSRHLKGIAQGLLGTFVSRNNDIYGYWGLGILRSLAVNNGLTKIFIDLTENDDNFSDTSPLRLTEHTYKKRLNDMLDKAGIDQNEVSRAEIRIEFCTFEEYPKAVRDTRGEPYVCSVLLSNRFGSSYVASKIGVCAPHDPNKDRKSTRVDET